MNATTTKTRAVEMHANLLRRYCEPMFRGTAKPREGDQRFGRLVLDAKTAIDLGSSNVGLFVEGCPSFERMVEHFRNLSETSTATWVVVASSKQVRDELARISKQIGASMDTLDSTAFGNVIVATPEELQVLAATITNLAGILVVDYACHIHKCRGNAYRGFRAANDRPQKIVDFRMQFKIGEWSPPFIMFTNRKAMAVNTLPMLSPYCLETFRYIDGKTMRFGKVVKPKSSVTLTAV